MVNLPDRRWRQADGWIVRNLRLYGNSMVPHGTVKALMLMFSEEKWKETTEEILTQILLEQNVLDPGDRVWLEPSWSTPGAYVARWH